MLELRTMLGRCSAAVTGPRTVFTAAHCVRGVDEAQLELGDHTAALARVESVGPGDFAVLRLPFYRFDASELTPLVVATKQPAAGDELELLGFGCSGDREARALLATRPGRSSGCACHGDSGGPVLNTRGEVVGVFIGWTAAREVAFTQVTAQP